MHNWYVEGFEWTQKNLFVYPNEYVYWSIQIVMYPLITGLVAGSFVLSSLYHLFGLKELKDMAKFALVFSFALLLGAPIPLLLHLQQPLRGIEIYLTPHFTSAISAFGVVYLTYALIVVSEIWFVYRPHFVKQAMELKEKRGPVNFILALLYRALTLGAYDIGPDALAADHKAIKFLAGIGVPSALFLHGYAGFIFGSVKANALWMSPLIPIIFIMSAIVSGVALCIFTFTVIMEWKKHVAKKHLQGEALETLRGSEIEMVRVTTRYLVYFMIVAFSLELLDLVFRGYTAVRSWEALEPVIFKRDWVDIFVKQYFMGYVLPFILLLWPRLNVRRALLATALVVFGVYMMRWNTVIGGQEFSLTFKGFMDYVVPIIPHNYETFKEGFLGALTVGALPFVFFYFINKLIPSFPPVRRRDEP